MAMRICITNDDGIRGEGLQRLVQWAGKLGEVHVFAPKVEQSAKSHAVEIHKPFEAKTDEVPGAVKAWAVDSTPADCVRLAILGLHMEFDLVISGINRGLNIGRDILYSGTVSAVMEAGNLGVKAMAVSTSPEYYGEAAKEMDKIWAFMEKHDLFAKHDLYNINIPTGGSEEFRFTRQGGNFFSDNFRPDPDNMYFPCGVEVFAACGSKEFDTDAVLVDKVNSVMPLTLDRTDLSLYTQLRKM